jgi:hypothetical protein
LFLKSYNYLKIRKYNFVFLIDKIQILYLYFI